MCAFLFKLILCFVFAVPYRSYPEPFYTAEVHQPNANVRISTHPVRQDNAAWMMNDDIGCQIPSLQQRKEALLNSREVVDWAARGRSLEEVCDQHHDVAQVAPAAKESVAPSLNADALELERLKSAMIAKEREQLLKMELQQREELELVKQNIESQRRRLEQEQMRASMELENSRAQQLLKIEESKLDMQRQLQQLQFQQQQQQDEILRKQRQVVENEARLREVSLQADIQRPYQAVFQPPRAIPLMADNMAYKVPSQHVLTSSDEGSQLEQMSMEGLERDALEQRRLQALKEGEELERQLSLQRQQKQHQQEELRLKQENDERRIRLQQQDDENRLRELERVSALAARRVSAQLESLKQESYKLVCARLDLEQRQLQERRELEQAALRAQQEDDSRRRAAREEEERRNQAAKDEERRLQMARAEEERRVKSAREEEERRAQAAREEEERRAQAAREEESRIKDAEAREEDRRAKAQAQQAQEEAERLRSMQADEEGNASDAAAKAREEEDRQKLAEARQRVLRRKQQKQERDLASGSTSTFVEEREQSPAPAVSVPFRSTVAEVAARPVASVAEVSVACILAFVISGLSCRICRMMISKHPVPMIMTRVPKKATGVSKRITMLMSNVQIYFTVC
jgi:hypothetical protein